MAIWKDFEQECADYLNRKFGQLATFSVEGGEDSTRPDIHVITRSGKRFYIEAKHCPAQCGQFVLLPHLDTLTFTYSSLNTTELNDCSQKIIDYMNDDFETFKEAGTSGKSIEIENGSHIFSQWIISHYKNKGTKYFITNNFEIVPIDAFENYFCVTAKYRVKRSGSSSVGKNRMQAVINYISTLNNPITIERIAGDKLFVSCRYNIHDKRFIYDGNEYMFSARDDVYEVRKLSNTFNANVIFSINNKQAAGVSDEEFILELR